MEAIILILLTFLLSSKLLKFSKINADSFYIKAILLILFGAFFYFGICFLMDIRNISIDLHIDYYRPLLVELNNLAKGLIENNQADRAGWFIIALSSYRKMLISLVLIIGLLLFYLRSKKEGL